MKMKKVISVVLACACVFSFAACGSKSDSSKSDSAKSDKKEKLVMATNAEFPPFEYYDGDEVVGIDAEFAAAIADKLGMDLKIEDMAFDSIIPAVQSGKADIGAAGMTVTEDRATQVDFSDSYYTGVQVIIVTDDSDITGPDDLKGKKILVTAGPTQESVDPVRYLTNHSSGKMGYDIAKAAMLRGADVTLVSGRTSIEPPMFVKLVPVVTARDMYEAVTSVSNEQDIIIKAAAVADYRPSRISEEKVKKSDGQMSIELERTDDILKFLGEHKRDGQFLCGFSMETQNVIDNSRAKLAKKNLDMVAANNVKVEGAGFQGDTNVLTLITQDEEISLPLMSKEDAAFRILDKILSMMQDSVC